MWPGGMEQQNANPTATEECSGGGRCGSVCFSSG